MAQLRVEARLAADDVLVALLALEPLLDLDAGLIGLADVQPVAARALGRFGGQDLDDIAVVQRRVVAGDAVIDLRADHGVADGGMDGVGKVDGRGAGGQGDDLALGRKDEDLVVEHVDLERVDIVVGLDVLLVLEQTPDPLEFLFRALARVLLVFPVRRDAVFRGLVHLPRADLHLEGDALRADDRRVQRLVHVGLRRGDIVLEAAGDGVEKVMDMAEDVIAVGDVVDDHAERVEVVQLVDRLVLRAHLAVDGVGMLDPPVDRPVDADGGQAVGDLRLDGVHEAVGAVLVLFEIVDDLLIALGIEVLQRRILQLPLDLLHAEPVGQRRIDLHRLHGLGDLLGGRLVLQGAGVVQPVGDLDEDDPDVLRHGHEHLAQIFHLLLFHRGILHARELRDALDEVCYGLAEHAGDLLKARVGVFQTVVQQRGCDRVGVQTDLRHDLRHGQRVDDIGLAGFAQLVLVLFVGVFVGPLDDLQIGGGRVAGDRLHHGGVMFFSGFHSGSCLLLFEVDEDRALFQIDLAPVGAQADQERLRPLLELHEPLLCQNVQADARFSGAQRELCAA